MENMEKDGVVPTPVGRVPEIIIEFFSGPSGRSLMVRGAPGTGKTTFALEILSEMKKHHKVCFISSRVLWVPDRCSPATQLTSALSWHRASLLLPLHIFQNTFGCLLA